ncbi:MAG TPA: carbamoyltransferase HypF, partial [Acetobacteraceae bacterium]|nr:carbamoyltransferase HypF [Acetobacteraceae bacterium]
PIRLPGGFAAAPSLLAFGGELKATFCLLGDGRATLSQHLGDLEDARTFADFRRMLRLYAELFDHVPEALAADEHPEYLSAKLARERAATEGLRLIEVQHHHAHVASCLAENHYPIAAPPVLGIVLDGLGWGDDGTIWGGEFLIADYRRYERLGCFKPVPMPGGVQAVREPWRNLYAHIATGIGWAGLEEDFSETEVYSKLAPRSRAVLDAMIGRGVNAPLASSCGRLFDAVAAALGLCCERQAYEGHAASMLEAVVDEAALCEESEALAYSFDIVEAKDMPILDPAPMWNALLADLSRKTPRPVIAARFHKGLAQAIVVMAARLRGTADRPRFETVALSGGCLQNKVLFEEVLRRLKDQDFSVLAHEEIPANDGGLALGQAAVAAARLIAEGEEERTRQCASAFPAAS